MLSLLFWIVLSCSSSSCASVYEFCATGCNSDGDLGLGDNNIYESQLTSMSSEVASSLSYTAIEVSAGFGHSLTLASSGLVYAAGLNAYGQLGLGNAPTNRWTPTLITAGGLLSVSIVAISAGYRNSMMLSNTGFVYAAGSNEYGQLGLGDAIQRTTPTLIAVAGGSSSVSITAISAGNQLSMMLSNTGFVYAAGSNEYGQLGLGDAIQRTTPTMVTAGGSSSVSITAISAGNQLSMMLSNSGFVYSTGYNGYGGLGLGDFTDRYTPALIAAGGLSSLSITAISAGFVFSLMLSNTSHVYYVGLYEYQELPDREIGIMQCTPTLITAGGLSSVSITAVAAGLFHSLMLSNSGSVYSTGRNVWGELGLGDRADRWTPTLIPSVSAKAISAGIDFSLVLADQGCQIAKPSGNYLYLIGVIAAAIVIVGVVVALVFWRRKRQQRTIVLQQQQQPEPNSMPLESHI